MLDRFLCVFGNIYLACFLLHTAYLALMVPLGRAVGLHPRTLKLFAWRIFAFEVRKIRIEIGWIPFQAAVICRDGELERLKPWQIIGFQLAGLLPALMVVVLFRVLGGFSRSVSEGFATVWAGIFAPLASARGSVATFYELAGGSVSWSSLGLLIGCLLPLLILGTALSLPSFLTSNRRDEDMVKTLSTSCALLMFVVYGSWAVGTLAFVMGG